MPRRLSLILSLSKDAQPVMPSILSSSITSRGDAEAANLAAPALH